MIKRIGIIGSGPAGFYTCEKLIKNLRNIEVDIIEALPIPFGLVRYGVAPDQ
jgi:adrenodoxin-NADP+ reductase